MSLTPAKWQTLTEEGDERTEMLRVSGGWLYRTTYRARGWPSPSVVATALVFQPEAIR